MKDSPPCRLFVDQDAKPIAIHKSRPVPVHWQEEVKRDLDCDVRLGVLEGPLMDDPAIWCAPMHVAEQKNGKPRRTVDFQGLNKSCQRQTHAVKAPFHQCSAVPPGMYKTTLGRVEWLPLGEVGGGGPTFDHISNTMGAI